MKSVFWWRKPEYPEETTDLRQVTDETFHTYGLCPVRGLNLVRSGVKQSELRRNESGAWHVHVGLHGSCIRGYRIFEGGGVNLGLHARGGGGGGGVQGVPALGPMLKGLHRGPKHCRLLFITIVMYICMVQNFLNKLFIAVITSWFSLKSYRAGPEAQ